ncbi:MAG TPA: hypothetical protein PKY56_07010 [Candidatus Kapabacteria bacterium]|nr:hypothetical protein [Candidatus Kapabacteria bacterium]
MLHSDESQNPSYCCSTLYNFNYFDEAFGLAQMFREQAHWLSEDGFWHTLE